MYLSGTNFQVTINKGLSQDQNFQSFSLSGKNFTGSIEFRQKNINSGSGKLIWILSVDKRTQSIQRKICLRLSNKGDCLERNK
jgi:hypothetical protein